MSVHFLDSSALVKRYVTETGSPWIRGLTAPEAHNRLIIARVTWVEVLSALGRLQREGSLTLDDVGQATRAFRYDWDMQYQTVELDLAVTETAGDLVLRYPLRAYDAVQLASALRVQSRLVHAQAPSLAFISADDRLLTIAQAEGLLTDNPNDHP